MAADDLASPLDAVVEAEADRAVPTTPAADPAAPVRLYLVDGSGYIFRAFHALPPLSRKTDGLPVGAVSGFCNMLWKFLGDMKSGGHDLKGPTHLAVIFDKSEKTFRTAISPEYKAHRPPPPDDLVPQFPLVREATRAFGVPALELEGYEADDLIATYARACAATGGEVVIVSSDKDLMQLVNEQICMLDPVKDKRICAPEVFEKFGVHPDKVIDVQALAGDSVDNVPGAPGIGIKTAAQLITEYGDLDTLLERAGEIKQPKRRETLLAYADQIRLSRQLVTLDDAAPLPAPIDELALREFDAPTLHAFLESMEFRGLARRVSDGRRPDSPPTPPHQGGYTNGRRPAPPGDDTAVEIDSARHLLIQDGASLDLLIAAAHECGEVAVAVQTDAACGENGVYGIALAVAPGQSAYVPLSHCAAEGLQLSTDDGGDWRQLDPAEALARLKPLLEAPGVLKVGHNVKTAVRALAHAGVALGPCDDVMLMSYAMEGGAHGHGLDELCQLHLGHAPIPWKSVVGAGQKQVAFAQVALGPATAYAAQEPDLALRLHRRLKPMLERSGLLTVYETLERPLPAVLAQMEEAGILVEPAALKRLSHEFGARMGELETHAHELAGHPFNLGSPKQVGDVLFGEQGLPGGRKTATGAWSTDADTLEGLAASHPLPMTILEHRQLAKLKGTYADALIYAAHPRDGRVRTTFMLANSSTGRLSATEPNLQNIPIRTEVGRQLRTVFVAEPGHVLISADYSQIELRLLAHVGDIPQLKAAFAAGVDIHAATASEMFGVPVEGMPSQTRSRAKAINFGIVYGISAFGLSNQLGIPQDEAGAYIKTYFERFPGIRAYMDEQRALVKARGWVETLFGRRIHIPDIRSKSMGQRQAGERQAINAPIQGAAADIIRRAMARMPAALEREGLRARMLLQVHDELVFEAPEAEAPRVCEVARRVMSRAAEPAVALSVPLEVDARAARNWDEAH